MLHGMLCQVLPQVVGWILGYETTLTGSNKLLILMLSFIGYIIQYKFYIYGYKI